MSQILRTLSDKLYESLLTPDEWPQALDLLRKTLDGVVYHHFTIHKDTREVVSSVISETVNPKHLAEYEQHLSRLDPRIPLIMKTPLGGVMWDHQHLSQAEIERHPVYAEFLKPQGYRHTVAIPLQDVGNTREVLAIVRAHDQRPFDLSHDLLIEQVLPDLQRTARLRNQLQHQRPGGVMAQSAWDALRAMPQALMLVDGQCKLHYANPAAERLLQGQAIHQADGAPAPNNAGAMRSHRGRLTCEHPIAQEALERMVQTACNDRLALPLQARVGSFWLHPEALGKAQRTVVNVLPMPPQENGNGLAPTPRLALVLVFANQDNGHAPVLNAKTLGATLGLTPTETRLALLLTRGRTLKEFAVEEGISWHTARTHIKNLMRKTHVNRQIDLVQQLRNMMFT